VLILGSNSLLLVCLHVVFHNRSSGRAMTPSDGEGMSSRAILLVDSHEYSRSLYSEYLASFGYRVVEAADGPSALQFINSQSFDLIVTELYLRGLSGKALISALRQEAKHEKLCIVVLTSQSDQHQRREAEAAGCTAFLTHPMLPKELLKTIDQLLAGAEATSPLRMV
jgi:CheY-like chemotaxis protein